MPCSERWSYERATPSVLAHLSPPCLQGWHWGGLDLKPEDMRHIVAIHNRNNEEAWQEVLKWELMHARYLPATPPVHVLCVSVCWEGTVFIVLAMATSLLFTCTQRMS